MTANNTWGKVNIVVVLTVTCWVWHCRRADTTASAVYACIIVIHKDSAAQVDWWFMRPHRSIVDVVSAVVGLDRQASVQSSSRLLCMRRAVQPALHDSRWGSRQSGRIQLTETAAVCQVLPSVCHSVWSAVTSVFNVVMMLMKHLKVIHYVTIRDQPNSRGKNARFHGRVFIMCQISRKIHGRSLRNSWKIRGPHSRYFEVPF